VRPEQISKALQLDVYCHRGALVIHFSTPPDLISRLSPALAAFSDLDRQADTAWVDGKVDDGRQSRNSRSALAGGGLSEIDPGPPLIGTSPRAQADRLIPVRATLVETAEEARGNG
jgi:hypothetical protein